MPVEDRADGVGDRLVHVVAVDEHRVDASDRAAFGRACSLEQPGQEREHARWVGAGGGRLPGRQADLALCHAEPGERVHHQQHVAVAVAEPLGDSGGGGSGTAAHQGRLVGGGDDDDRAGEPLRAEVALDELSDLTATFADHGDDVDVGRRVAGHHAEQRRLADAGTGEHTDALTAAERGERVPRPHTGRERSVDARPAQRMWWLALGRDAVDDAERRAIVDRYTHAVEHAAEQGVAGRHRDRVVIDVDACPDADSAEVTERHAAHPVTVDADHLADELVAVVAHSDTGTDGELEPFDVEPQADHLGHSAGRLRCDTRRSPRRASPTSRRRASTVGRAVTPVLLRQGWACGLQVVWTPIPGSADYRPLGVPVNVR